MKPVAENRLAGHGISVALPARWEGRLYRRAVGGAGEPGTAAAAQPSLRAQPGTALRAQPTATGWPGELSHPVLHLANFALPASRGDYGTGAVERMGPDNLFIALLEFGPDCLGTALYAPRGVPRVQPGQFNPNGMQRRVAGQAGFQHFFTEANRPFCLYVVIGSHRQAVRLAQHANEVLERIEVQHAG